MCSSSSLEELDGLVGGSISPKLWEEIEALNRTIDNRGRGLETGSSSSSF